MAAFSKMKHSLGIGYFIHPVPLLAVVILAVNDHYLKAAYPSILTGKLSDFVGVFFFPIFLCALWNLGMNVINILRSREQFHWITLRQGVIAIALTNLIFIGVKMIPEVTAFYVNAMGFIGFPSRVTPDATDLVALTMGIPTWIYIRKQAGAHALATP